MKQLNIVSYGAGVDSTAMILKMIEKKIIIDHVVFADTGGELPETYKTVKFMKKFLKKKNIPFEIVRNFSLITLLERCFIRKVFPDMFRRWCTIAMRISFCTANFWASSSLDHHIFVNHRLLHSEQHLYTFNVFFSHKFVS